MLWRHPLDHTDCYTTAAQLFEQSQQILIDDNPQPRFADFEEPDKCREGTSISFSYEEADYLKSLLNQISKSCISAKEHKHLELLMIFHRNLR